MLELPEAPSANNKLTKIIIIKESKESKVHGPSYKPLLHRAYFPPVII